MVKKIKEEIIGRMPTDNFYHQYTPINPYEWETNDTPEGLRHPVKSQNNIKSINQLFIMMIDEYEKEI